MNRKILPTENLSPEAATAIKTYHQTVVDEVEKTVGANRVVVVGMALNPFVVKAKSALKNANVQFSYLEYGGYTSKWKERLAIKLWSGWPTFPQVFVDGKLVGGFTDLKKAIDEGRIK